MVQIAGFANSFSAGEIADEAQERTDLAQHQAGCAEAINFLGAVAGPNLSRGGSLLVGASRYSNKFRRFIPWFRSDAEGLVLEFGAEYFRVWTARGEPVLSGGSPLEVAHPFLETELKGLRFTQVGDLAYITRQPGTFPRVLTRLSDTSWTIDFLQYRDGPWLPENTDLNKILTLTENTGYWDVEANFDLFTAQHVGAAFRIRATGGSPGHRSWAGGISFNAGESVVSAGRIYSNQSTTGAAGNTPPTHDRGDVSDGAKVWRYLYDGANPIFITVVTDARHARAHVPYQLPIVAPGPGSTSNWSEGAFSDARGWPTAMSAVREERLVQGGPSSNPDLLFLTRSYGFDPTTVDFKPGLGTGLVTDDDAVRVGLGGSRSRIVWAVEAGSLLVGTVQGEYLISGQTPDDPISPAGVKARALSSWGSADVMPVVIQGPPARLLHVARGGQTLRETVVGPDMSTEGRDLSFLASHIFGAGVSEMAWQRPDNHLWIALADGSLAVLTYHHEQGILGARRQELGGGWKVESLCAVPDPDGRDLVHLAAVRTKDGSPQRQHLVIQPRAAGIFLDMAVTYDGSPTTLIPVGAWANGETLSAVADGGLVEGLVVSDGNVTLPSPASLVHVGHPMRRRFKSLPLDLGGPGSMLAKSSRVVACMVVLGGVYAEVGVEGQDLAEPTQAFERVESRRATDEVPVSRRMRARVSFGAGAERDNRLVVQSSQPFDLAVYALRPVASAN